MHLHECPSTLRDHYAGLDRDLRAGGVDDEVHAGRAAVLDPELLRHGLGVALRVRKGTLALLALRGEVRLRPGVLLRELKAGGHDVDRDDAGGAEGARDGQAQQPDGARTEDGYGLVRTQLRDVGDCVDGDGERLHLRSLVISGTIGGFRIYLPTRRPRV